MVGVLSGAALYHVIGGSAPTRDELAARYARQLAGPGRGDEAWLNWIIHRDDAAVGFVQATASRRPPGWSADLAWVVGTGAQGQGVAGEAAAAVARFLSDAGFAALTAHIAEGHIASERVARRLGMKPTAVTERDERVWVVGTGTNRTAGDA